MHRSRRFQAFKVFTEKLAIILVEYALVCYLQFFSLVSVYTLSLFLSVLTTACCGDFPSGLVYLLFHVLLVFGSFLSLGTFSSVILLKTWSMPLTWDSSSSSMLIIGRFVFMMPHVPCVLPAGFKCFHVHR